MLHIPSILNAAQLAEIRAILAQACWIDGRATAGHHSHRVKHNRQVAEQDPAAMAAGAIIIKALEAHPIFVSAALPVRIVPPLFNRYATQEAYGPHIDGAIRPSTGPNLVRTDLSATLFLTDPEEYSGGELCIRLRHEEKRFRFSSGDLLLYSAGNIHHVEPVTAGERTAAILWMQSLVRDATRREMLFDLDQTIQRLVQKLPDAPEITELHGHYHNLLRQWADT